MFIGLSMLKCKEIVTETKSQFWFFFLNAFDFS